ncbi:class I SAM-dependent methyltransferase [Thiohalobacter sp.]|uniref:class I SAM-dependent methyltransferase n=1 Tax=Thiohalobacter sp. TaxID=2025948 RepID=UPI00260A7BF6|nr:methyltransferase domain-containing protein [Thiohalobacter sp.]
MGREQEGSGRQRCRPHAVAALRDWFRSPLGRALGEAETTRLRASLGSLFGYHMLLVDAPWTEDVTEASRVRNRFRLNAGAGNGPLFEGRADALPVITDSIDIIVLPHVLEFSSDPHAVLREVDRCLIPEGHVVIVGFNPWSLWGLRSILTGWRGQVPWCGRFLGAGRLRDWLALLGFATVEAAPIGFRPPVGSPWLLERAGVLDRLADRGWRLPAAAYLLVARKRVMGLTPIKPRWRPRRGLLSPGIAEPTSRSGNS